MLELHPPRTTMARPFSALGRKLGLEECIEARYTEHRLAPGRDQVDDLFAIPYSGARSAYVALRAYARNQAESADWEAIVAFVRKWAASRPRRLARVSTVWLEFDDIEREGVSSRPPSVSACILPDYDPDEPITPESGDGDLATVRAVLGALGVDPRGRDVALLGRCFEALPEGGRFIHVSLMLGRRPRAVKLYGTMRRAQLLPYLEAVRWNGSTRGVKRALDELYPRQIVGDEIFVDLNLGTLRNAPRATLGLAIGQQHTARGPNRDPSRTRLLDIWTKAGLCTREKARAAHDWVRVPGNDEWENFLDLKLVWSAVDGFTAKAYLGAHRARHFW